MKSLGGKFVEIDLGDTGQTEQGYAKELTPEQLELQKAGQKKIISVVVEPDHGACYGDVAPVVDALLTIGFSDVNFGGGLGSQAAGKYSRQPRKGK